MDAFTKLDLALSQVPLQDSAVVECEVPDSIPVGTMAKKCPHLSAKNIVRPTSFVRIIRY